MNDTEQEIGEIFKPEWIEVVEKKPTEAIFAANAAVLGAKVGYTIS